MRKTLTILIASLILSAIACSDSEFEKGSPSDVLKTFIEAKKKRDVEAIKQTISADSLKLYEDMARQQKTTVEALLTDNTGGVLQDVPPMRNEKIKGDIATVEAQVPQTGVWQEISFVKEDTGWKLALDKAVIEADKKVLDSIKEKIKESSGPESGNSFSNDQFEINANK